MGIKIGRRTRLMAGLVAVGMALGVTTLAPPANAVTKVYTATKTIPVPPSSAYAGGGGGDGWDVSMTPRAVYNVFHHQSSTYVACHLQATAEACTPEVSRRITDEDGNDFVAQGHSSTYLDQGTGRLFIWGIRGSKGADEERVSDWSAGVICVDTTLADDTPNPFCGYDITAPTGQAQANVFSGTLSAGIRIGSRWYSFNYVNQAENLPGSAANKLMCFDLQTQNPCAGQPFDLGVTGTYANGQFPAPAASQAGGKVIIPMSVDGVSLVTCFDPALGAACSGAWPATTQSSPSQDGSAFPVLDATGTALGFCIPTGTADDCFDLEGAHLAVDQSLVQTLTSNEQWNGPPVVLGDRVYLPNGTVDNVQCYDFGSAASCPNFPRSTDLGAQGYAGYMYTISTDPQRPECLWVNADGGSAQIQNFDAFTGGPCGSGALRVLASSIVQPDPQCVPDVYTQLKVLAPARDGYESGTVGFLDSNGEAIDGVTPKAIDADGAVDLSDLNLTSASGLPQFLISLEQTGETDLSAVTLELTWTGDADADCTPSTTVSVDPPHGLTGDTFTLGYSCPADPTVVVTKPDGSAAAGVTLGSRTSTNSLDYTQPVTITTAGEFVATVSCSGNDARSVVFDTVTPIDGTMGPGWPQDVGGVDLIWSYGGGHLFRGSVVAGTTSWNDAVEGVGFTEWTGDATPVNISFADVTLPDDTYALTFFPEGADTSYSRLFVYLNPAQLDGASSGLRTKIVTHELGHVLSLPDEDPSSTNVTVMKQGPLAFSAPQAYDIDRVNARY